MYLSFKNFVSLLLLFGSLFVICLSIWWLKGEGGREPIVALATAIVTFIGVAFRVEWSQLKGRESPQDLEIFRKGDNVLSETRLNNIVIELNNPHTIRRDNLVRCREFVSFCKLEENSYLDKKLNKSRSKFRTNLIALLDFMREHFSVLDRDRYRLEPELLAELDGADNTKTRKYSILSKTLQELTQSSVLSFHIYRKTVKRRLRI